MPIAYRTSKELGLTVSVWDGIVTSQDSLDYLLRVAADVDWPPGPLGLVDMRTVITFAPADPEVAFELLDGSEMNNDTRKVAVLAAPVVGEQRTGLANDLGLMAMRFNDLHDACEFLGVQAGDVAPILAGVRAQLEGDTAG